MSDVQLSNHWRKVLLGEVTANFISGGTPSSKEPRYWDGPIAWTTSAPITEDDTRLTQAQRFITQDGLLNSATNVVPKGSLLVGTRVGVGKAVVNEIDIAISQDLTAVILDVEQVHPEFVAYQFKTGAVKRYLDGRKRGTTIKGISRFDLQSLPLNLPPLPEQRAIAQVLRAAQEARESRQRELALERERKAALMQCLFTYGTRGESTPVQLTRFGNVPEHWRIVLLSECASVQTGVAKGRKLGSSSTIMVPYLRVANVQDGYLDLTEIKEIEIRTTELKQYLLQPGDVVLTEGGDFDQLGRGFVWTGQIPNCVHQNHIFAVRVQRSLLLPEFLAYLIQSTYGKSYFLSVAHKTTNLASINTSKLKAFPLLIPDLVEQRDIVEALTACDTKIATLEQEDTVLSELFSAMLEELITGRLSAAALVEEGVEA